MNWCYHINIYPNPARESLQISGIPSQVKWLKVYNSFGQLIIAEPVSDTRMTLDLSSLPQGLYLLSDGISTLKFIRQ